MLEGSLRKCYHGASRFDEKNKYRLTIYSENIDYQSITAYDESPAKLTPGWFKDQNGYVNLASEYDIPVMDIKGRTISMDDFLGQDDVYNSRVKIKIKQTDGAIYPLAMKILTPGEPKDPFEGM